MRIRTKFLLSAICSLFLILLACGLLFGNWRSLSARLAQMERVNEAMRGVFTLNTLAHEYVATPVDRARRQWLLQLATCRGIVDRLGAVGPAKQEIVARIGAELGSMEGAFQKIVAMHAQGALPNSPADQAAYELLVEQTVVLLFSRSRSVLDEVDLFNRLVQEEVVAGQLAFGVRAAAMLGLLVVVVGFLSLLLPRPVLAGLEGLRLGSARIGDGDLAHRIPLAGGDDEIDRVGKAFNEMAGNLQAAARERQQASWLRDGMAALDERLRQATSVQEVGRSVLDFLAPHLHALVGALYVTNEGGELKMAAGYACGPENVRNPVVPAGSGLVGQAALDLEPIVVDDVPEGYLDINSALGVAPPRQILVVPLLYGGGAAGVLELGFAEPAPETVREFLHRIATSLGTSLASALSRDYLQDALERTQEQAEELKAQQEELRAANEELEEQTRRLQASEEQLREQQEELRATNEELEEKTHLLEEQAHEVQEKNQALQAAREQLEMKARDLEATSRYKSQFLANMSHELRTPLNSMLILAQDLAANRQGNLDAEQVESAEIVHSSGRDLLRLINEILDLAKVEAGRIDLRPDRVVLKDFVGALARNFRPLVTEKQLELKLETGADLPDTVVTDAQRLEQILGNLLANAVKFTERGTVTIHVHRPDATFGDSLPAGFSPQDCVVFTVRDTGIGIPEEQQAMVFEAFRQVDGSVARQYGGTGLGLTIARNFARLLGGDILLRSAPGQGAAFSLVLPEVCHRPPEPVGQPAPAASLDALEPQPPAAISLPSPVNDDRQDIERDDRVVLVVEDDPRFAEILGRFVRERHFKFLHAAGGRSGLEMAREHKPDAIVLDIRLPEMDGWEVLERLKGDPALRHIPVHMMSVEKAVPGAFGKGIVGFLTKPVSREDLEQAFDKIEEILSGGVRRVLLVEDDPNQRRSIVRLLGDIDVEIQEAETGAAALAALRNGHFDCVILDLNLPDCSGFDVLEEMRSWQRPPATPVIVYTGQLLSEEDEERLRPYASSVIIKGVMSPERLLDETALFLHRVVARMPAGKRDMILSLYDGEAVFENRTVLLVDDDMRNVFAIGRVLEERGMEVVRAANGRKGLEALEARPDIDLVLMDIMMPEMDGYEAMRAIRSQERFRSLPVIALTAKAMRDDREKCLEAGASDYLPKPVDVERLLSLLRVWLYR